MKMINTSTAFGGDAMPAPVTSTDRILTREALRERSIEPTFTMSTGEVRPQPGAVATAAMTPTADIQDPARVRSWSPPG